MTITTFKNGYDLVNFKTSLVNKMPIVRDIINSLSYIIFYTNIVIKNIIYPSFKTIVII